MNKQIGFTLSLILLCGFGALAGTEFPPAPTSALTARHNSVRWVQLSPVNSPSPRSSFAMTYDGAAEK